MGNKKLISGRPGLEAAKKQVLLMLQEGHSVKDCMKSVRRSDKTYESWRSYDGDFKKQVQLIRDMRKSVRSDIRGEHGDTFEDFRREYLGMETFTHQLQWIDLIEGRPPRDLHVSQKYEEGDPHYILINTAPELRSLQDDDSFH